MYQFRIKSRQHTPRLVYPQINSKWSHVPVELYASIVQHIWDKKTLATLARVSRAMQDVAEHELYHSILLHPIETPALCKCIMTCRRLWSMIRKCDVFIQLQYSNNGLPNEKQIICTSRRLLACLRYFCRLNDLHIQSILKGTRLALESSLNDCQFGLRTFHCCDPFDVDIQNFLLTQPNIEELVVPSSQFNSQYQCRRGEKLITPNKATLPGQCLQKLTTIRVLTPSVLELLVSGRPITRVEVLFWDGNNIEKMIANLALSTKPIKSLQVLNGLVTGASELKYIGEQLPELVYLGECLFVDKFDEILIQLSTLKKLETIVVNHRSFMAYREFIDASALIKPPKNIEYHMVLGLSVFCRSLNRIVFSFQTGTRRCWERRGRDWEARGKVLEVIYEELWRR